MQPKIIFLNFVNLLSVAAIYVVSYLSYVQVAEAGTACPMSQLRVSRSMRSSGDNQRLLKPTNTLFYCLGPQKEVISIYGDDFAAAASRPQYFIEAYRCVKVEVAECYSGRKGYPVPSKTEEIQIVVPDTRNRDRDPTKKKKFYKYVVYNHTSCECGQLNYRNRKLYKTITNNTGQSSLP